MNNEFFLLLSSFSRLLLKILSIVFFFAERNNVQNTSDEENVQCVPCITKSNILHNIENDKRVNKVIITPLQESSNREEKNISRITRKKKRKLLSTDKGKQISMSYLCHIFQI